MLTFIKLAHTAIWAVLAGSVLGIPVAAWWGRFEWALGLAVLVLLECVVLAANHGRCPLTGLAARYTEDRSSNFDIYLPLWLARHNKLIFGSLFLLGGAFALGRWWLAAGS